MKRFITLFAALMLCVCTANAQNFLKKLGETAKNAAENALNSKVGEKVENAVNKAVDNVTDKASESVNQKSEKKSSSESEDNSASSVGSTSFDSANNANIQYDDWDLDPTLDAGGAAPAAPAAVGATPQVNPIEMTYAKSDFVPGDEIIFDDNLEGEQLGEFPSKWDIIQGAVEISKLNGENVILCASPDDPTIVPLFDDMKNYLPEMFTLEFDFWVGPYSKDPNGEDDPQNRYEIYFLIPDHESRTQEITIDTWYSEQEFSKSFEWIFDAGGDMRNGQVDNPQINSNAWNHFALSFNKRAMKLYINGIRYGNIPNTTRPGHFQIQFYRSGGHFQNNSAIKNIRVAQGAVPLYNRMMSDGKFITYGITFDIGKSTIKPESMGEINRIVTLMTENPSLKFFVEGHTDNTGNAASNQTLSENRSKAIVDKLVEMGIAPDRLSSSGKGQNSPIADNSTDEGRAKNRRVEFVKK